jgi:glycosyltransferase involved in cell wall biosynthesis
MGHDVNIIAISNRSGIEDSEIGRIYTVKSSILPSKSATSITGIFFLWSQIIGKKLQNLIKNYNDNCIIYGIGPWGHSAINSKKRFPDKVRLVSVFFTTAYDETYWLMRGTSIRDYGLFLKMKYSIIHYYAKYILSKFEHTALKKSDQIVLHYEFAKQSLIAQYKIDSNKILKIPYYTEIYDKNSLYSKYDRSLKPQPVHQQNKSTISCISICRQEPRKGINYFIRAIKILKDNQFPIRAKIVGSGDLLEKNMKMAKKLKLDDTIEFTGFVENISDILSESDIFIQPSLQEGSGSISVFEAMLSGVPVITTTCDGLPEDIENNFSGILIPPMNSESLAKAIMNLSTNNELINRLVSNGIKTVEEKLDMNKMIEGLILLHNKIWNKQ